MVWLLIIHLLFLVVAGRTNSTNTTHATNSSELISLDVTAANALLRGVAIGGWLVLEPYITPSLFLEFNSTKNSSELDIPYDEYRYCKKLGKKEAKKRLEKHWSTFYNESDFENMKNIGLNMVRIPIGYWAFEQLDGDPYVYGAQEYLDKAIEWAYNNDLKVWVDLHGVPGSQNGFDNSGYRDIGYPGWFNKTENVELSYKVLEKIYKKYGGKEMYEKYPNTIIGIEVVNEPFSTKLPIKKILNFYKNTYLDARSIQEVNNTIVFHDAFESAGYWNNFLSSQKNSSSDNYNIMIDHHHYEVFDAGQLNLTIGQHIDSIKGYVKGLKKELKHHPAVVGEWCAALTDCSPWLNGVGLGARYDGGHPYNNDPIGTCDDVNDFDAWSEKRKKVYRKFIEIQLDQYEQLNGWVFWCYKTETTIEWDLKRLVELDLFPQPFDDREYIINGTDTDSQADDDDNDLADGSERKGDSDKSGAPTIAISLMVVFAAVFHLL